MRLKWEKIAKFPLAAKACFRIRKETYVNEFEAEMEAMKTYDLEVHKWLTETIHVRNWSKAHFDLTTKRNVLLNSQCEVFNSNIFLAKSKSTLGML